MARKKKIKEEPVLTTSEEQVLTGESEVNFTPAQPHAMTKTEFQQNLGDKIASLIYLVAEIDEFLDSNELYGQMFDGAPIGPKLRAIIDPIKSEYEKQGIMFEYPYNWG